MFTNQTVFVLGAGVSKPFGFPVGKELKDAICLPTSPRYELMKELLTRANNGASNTVKRFMEAFHGSDMYSIDVWLEANKKEADLLQVGKCAIAAIIMDAETKAIQLGAPVEKDWFAWLWNNLWTPNIEDLEKNKVSFITFNYDRLFEWKLAQQIKNTYLRATVQQHEKAFEALKSRIVHVHGELKDPTQPNIHLLRYGELSLGALSSGDGAKQNYDRDYYARHMLVYSRAINIVCETPESDVLIEEAKKFLNNQSRLVFLGFSFDRRNVLKMGFDTFSRNRGNFGRGRDADQRLDNYPIIGTGMGIMPGERFVIATMFNEVIELGGQEMDAVTFCRSHVRPS
jgi:hypothetical protein